MQTKKFNLIFLLPLRYRPLKVNVARKYELLSGESMGHIFALSGSRMRNLEIANFRFHAEPDPRGFVRRNLRRIRLQIFLPIRLLWRKCHVDAVIAYDPYSSALCGIVLKFLFRTNLIVEINGDYHAVDPSERFIKKWLMRLIYRVSLRWADAVKVLNKSQEMFVRQRLPTTRIYRFPDYVATEYFGSLTAIQGDYLLSVGHPFHLKGMDILIGAFRRICDKHEGMRLRIMGYCPDHEMMKYRELAGHDPRIEFIKPGWIEDVGDQMRGCYALVNAGRSEALGRVQLEAMACGKPIVATRTNGALECIEDGKTGLLCEIENVEDLAEKLDYILSSRQLAIEMGRAGLERVRNGFSEDRYVKSFLAMVGAVVTSGGETSGYAHKDGR